MAGKKTAKKRGRRTDCTPEIIKEICEYVRVDGMTIRSAALIAGVSSTAFHYWREKALEDPKTPYGDLMKAAGKAEQLHKRSLLQKLDLGESGNLKFLLERRHSEDYGSKTKVDLKADVDVAVGWADIMKSAEDNRRKREKKA